MADDSGVTVAPSSTVKVAVRVRPFNQREIDKRCESVVTMEGNTTSLKYPMSTSDKARAGTSKTFSYDHCFWSTNSTDAHFATQTQVYKALGVDVLDNAFSGYNACIFAYGQTGSGKSYTMMGTAEDRGVIPRLCQELFERIRARTAKDANTSTKVEVSYLEIYNEQVRDLLNPSITKDKLRVREHPVLGPYVENLAQLPVSDFTGIERLMEEGNKSRAVASTNMNAESSRSHAVFTLLLTQTTFDDMTKLSTEKVSKISLVDLAGSERAGKTGGTGDRLKEAGNINKSLTTLGLVISGLADASSGKKSHVPYRDSVLTWLLKDNLGGNSKTVMIATVSPADDNHEESLSTLRYADRAKRIENHAVVNEDPNAKIIRELRAEVARLKAMIPDGAAGAGAAAGGASGAGAASNEELERLQSQLSESQALIQDLTRTWEEKLQMANSVHTKRHQALEEMGISVGAGGISVDHTLPYLVNLSEDSAVNEFLVYYLRRGETRVGRPAPTGEAGQAPVTPVTGHSDIQLSGPGVLQEHCIIHSGVAASESGASSDAVFLTPIAGASVKVNGRPCVDRIELRHGDRLLIGATHLFRFNCAKLVAKKNTTNDADASEPQFEPNPALPAASDVSKMDWAYAQKELALQEAGIMMESILRSALGDAEETAGGAATDAGATPETSATSIQGAIQTLKSKYSQEKESALAEQRLKYEEQLQLLMQQQLQLQQQQAETEASLRKQKEEAELEAKQALEDERRRLAEQQVALQAQLERAQKQQQEAEAVAVQEAAASSTLNLPQQSKPRSGTVRRNVELERIADQAVEATILVREANAMSSELGKDVNFSIKLQLARSSLSPTCITSSANGVSPDDQRRSEVVVRATLAGGRQHVLPLEAFRKRIELMRDVYQSARSTSDSNRASASSISIGSDSGAKADEGNDPFLEPPGYCLIGVASMQLACLAHTAAFEYDAPVIDQHGKIRGKLKLELERLPLLPAASPVSSDPSSPTSPMQQQRNKSKNRWSASFITRDSMQSDSLLYVHGSPSSSQLSSPRASTVLSEKDDGVFDLDAHAANPTPRQQQQQQPPTARQSARLSSTLPTSIATPPPAALPSNSSAALAPPVVEAPTASGSIPIRQRTPSGLPTDGGLVVGSTASIRIRVHSASGLPVDLCNHTYCRYDFLSTDVILPEMIPLDSSISLVQGSTVFDHENILSIPVTDNFVKQIETACLAVEIWGHHRAVASNAAPQISSELRSVEDSSPLGLKSFRRQSQAVQASKPSSVLGQRVAGWSDLVVELKLWVDLLELGSKGEWVSVESQDKVDVATGGIFQLKQGYARRIAVTVSHAPAPELAIESIVSLHLGALELRTKNDALVNTFDAQDAAAGLEKRTVVMEKRRVQLDEEIHKLLEKTDKTEQDKRTEAALINEWMALLKARDEVVTHSVEAGSRSDSPSLLDEKNLETVVPTIYFNMQPASAQSSNAAGASPAPAPALLPGLSAPVIGATLSDDAIQLQFIPSARSTAVVMAPNPHVPVSPSKTPTRPLTSTSSSSFHTAAELPHDASSVTASVSTESSSSASQANTYKSVASWDSSLHDSEVLNRVTEAGERVFATVFVGIKFVNFPQIVLLRKRICFKVYAKKAYGTMLRSLVSSPNKGKRAKENGCGILYHIIAQSPESASSPVSDSIDDGTLSQYRRELAAVDHILKLEKMRQELALQELLARMRL